MMVTVFVLKLTAGIVLMWLLMPRKDVTDGFFRIQMLVVLGLTVLTVLTLEPGVLSASGQRLPDQTGRTATAVAILKWGNITAALTAYLGHIFWKLGRRTPGRITIFVLGFLCLGSLGLRSLVMGTAIPALFQLGADAASAAVLGATLTGMLLGHWYLTTPTMSIQPLTWFARALLAAGFLRLLASGLLFLRTGWPLNELTLQLWIGIRLTGGVAVPIVASLMVMKILRFRNTQSATGVLFAALILVFMGEMSAALLERTLARPF